jgi:hypothetical protein
MQQQGSSSASSKLDQQQSLKPTIDRLSKKSDPKSQSLAQHMQSTPATKKYGRHSLFQFNDWSKDGSIVLANSDGYLCISADDFAAFVSQQSSSQS